MSNNKVIIVLPVEGSPYLWKNKGFTSKQMTKELPKMVQGRPQMIDNKTIIIHPWKSNRWIIANKLIKEEGVEIYANENGMNECNANLNCVRLQRDCGGKEMWSTEYFSLPLKPSSFPYFGNIALVMSRKVLCKHIHPDCLTLVRVEDYNEEVGLKKPDEPSTEEDYENYLAGYIHEPYSYEDDKKFCMLAKEKGWYRDSMGQVFLKPTGRPDEEEEEEVEEEEESDEDEDVPLPVKKITRMTVEDDD